MKKYSIYEMAVKALDTVDLAQEFKKICANGNVDATVIYRFLMFVMPLYEANKKELFAQAINQGVTELMDWLWEDPMNPTPYTQMRVLKDIAKELNITLKNDGRTD